MVHSTKKRKQAAQDSIKEKDLIDGLKFQPTDQELQYMAYFLYGEYAYLFDRTGTYINEDGVECQMKSIARYLARDIKMPSLQWTKEFIQAGGMFDSCDTWGLYPEKALEYELKGSDPKILGKVLSFEGRVDYGFESNFKIISAANFLPKDRHEYFAYLRGLERQDVAKAAAVLDLKSVLRYGWMKEDKWDKYILEKSTKLNSWTSYESFNGVDVRYLRIATVENKLFQDWYAKRPTEKQLAQKAKARNIHNEYFYIQKLDAKLLALGLRYNKLYYTDECNFSQTSVGRVAYLSETNNSYIACLVDGTWKAIKSRQVGNNSIAQINQQWFVWNTKEGFSSHMENENLRELMELWNSKTRIGEERPLSLNNVRNDRKGTAGFCLSGAKSFLRDRMPFVYNLVKDYKEWSQVPAEIMSRRWDLDFGVFKGYPVP